VDKHRHSIRCCRCVESKPETTKQKAPRFPIAQVSHLSTTEGLPFSRGAAHMCNPPPPHGLCDDERCSAGRVYRPHRRLWTGFAYMFHELFLSQAANACCRIHPPCSAKAFLPLGPQAARRVSSVWTVGRKGVYSYPWDYGHMTVALPPSRDIRIDQLAGIGNS
jgi:hypothetical protein